MGSIQDRLEEADLDRRLRFRAEHARKHGPPLIEKVNKLLWGSNVNSARVEQKQRALKEAIVMWMYDEGALSEK